MLQEGTPPLFCTDERQHQWFLDPVSIPKLLPSLLGAHTPFQILQGFRVLVPGLIMQIVLFHRL